MAAVAQARRLATTAAATTTARNFNLAVKCPGVHYLKKKGWSDQQIMQQESVEAEDIPACEQWVQAQPKGYVPPRSRRSGAGDRWSDGPRRWRRSSPGPGVALVV